ncbi:MAG: tyrosine-type recombinase/integrase [Bryobacteraceae bacterium]
MHRLLLRSRYPSSLNYVKKAANVTGRFHDGRHTFVTELAKAGATKGVIRSTVGYVSNRMLRHYAHVRTETKRSAIDAVETMNTARRNRAADLRTMEEQKRAATLPTTSPVVQ